MTKIIQRHDTAANWASVNPVLAQGEMGIEDDTRKFKFGDGATAWADLPYASNEGGGGDTPIATTDIAGKVKPDGTTISVTEDGTISSIPPANMITTDNIAANATITSMNSAIKTAQGNITTLQNQNTYPKIIIGAGKILDANGDTTEGYGNFTLTLHQNGICRIDFMCKITTAGTSSTIFDWGLNMPLLKAINDTIPTITASSGGSCVYINSSGALDGSVTGYAGTSHPSPTSRWAFGRIYESTGVYGGWASKKLPVGSYIHGFVVGTFNINEV